MDKTLIGGYVSVKSVMEAKSREIYEIILDEERFEMINRSGFHVPEKRQYKNLADSGIPQRFVKASEFAELMQNATAGGIAAYVGDRVFTATSEVLSLRSGYIAMLDGIEDPHNFAYSLRSLYAAGCDAVILPERNFFSASETVIRSSAGASEKIRACVVPDLADACKSLKSNGYQICCTAKSDKAKDLYRCRIQRPVCIVFGGEKRGIKQEVIDLSDTVIKIKYPRDCHFALPTCSAVSIIAFECARKLSTRP